MFRRMSTAMDTTVGSLLVIAAAAFGLVGWLTGLADNSNTTIWYISALILAIVAGAVMLDELRARRESPERRFDAVLGTLLLLAALGFGTVGFIIGLMSKAEAMTWLTSGVILALLSAGVMLDELRAMRSAQSRIDLGISSVGWAFGALGLALGVVGFILGITSGSHANTWLWAGVISSVVSFAWLIEAEHREVVEEHPVVETAAATVSYSTGGEAPRPL